MSLSKEELRKEVRTELCEALRFAGRAANLLRQATKEDCPMPIKETLALDTADALARIVASISDYINDLLK